MSSDQSRDKDHRQCWHCGGTEFRLTGTNEVRAVCRACGNECTPMNTYVPEETPRKEYKVS